MASQLSTNNSQLLQQHFDTLAETPEAVAKLREFILELAECGTFGGADAKKVPLHSVAEFVMGQAPAGTECNETGEGTIFVKAGEFGPLYAEVRCWTTRPLKFARKGDVLICVVGATVGKLNLAIDSAIGRSVAAIRPSENLDTRFLYYSLMPFTLRLRRASRGSAQGVIGREELRGINISLPPLAEQRRIVAKVEELLALCDEMEARQTAAREHRTRLVRSALDHLTTAQDESNFKKHSAFCLQHSELLFDSVPALRQAILSLAVQGRLGTQDSKDQPARGVGDAADASPPISVKRNEPPFNVPRTWQSKQLGQVSELINGDRSKNYPNKVEYVREGVPWINTGHIEPDGTLSLETMHYITRAKFDSLRSGKIKTGDLVYCLRGATLGKTAIISQFDEGAVASSLVIIRLSPLVNPKYAYCFLTSPLGRQQIWKYDNGSAQPNLSADSVKKYWIPLPPLAEQQRIVAKVDELLRWCDALEARLTAARTTATHLLDATLHQILNPAA